MGIIENIRAILVKFSLACMYVCMGGGSSFSCSNGVDGQQKMWIGFCVSTTAHFQKFQVCSLFLIVFHQTHKFVFAMLDSSSMIYLSNSLYGTKISDNSPHPIGSLASIGVSAVINLTVTGFSKFLRTFFAGFGKRKIRSS